jgi:hypothetical protein
VPIAEGVETIDQYDALASLDCDLAQGYQFSRPILALDIHSAVHRCNAVRAITRRGRLVALRAEFRTHLRRCTTQLDDASRRPLKPARPLAGSIERGPVPPSSDLVNSAIGSIFGGATGRRLPSTCRCAC